VKTNITTTISSNSINNNNYNSSSFITGHFGSPIW